MITCKFEPFGIDKQESEQAKFVRTEGTSPSHDCCLSHKLRINFAIPSISAKRSMDARQIRFHRTLIQGRMHGRMRKK